MHPAKRWIEVDMYEGDDRVATTSDTVEIWPGHRAEIYYNGEVIAFIHEDGTFTCPFNKGTDGQEVET